LLALCSDRRLGHALEIRGMQLDTRIVRGHFAFGDRALSVVMDDPFEIQIAIQHDGNVAQIAFDPDEIGELRDLLTEWLERKRRTPRAAPRR
jgi:hypothetical protein